MSKIRKAALVLAAGMMISVLMGGCGKQQEDEVRLNGSCSDILSRVYKDADLDEETRKALEDYVAMEIPEENKEYILGTTEVEYTDSVASVPMINVVPYQCVLLRIGDVDAIDETKLLLADNANLHKWVCVEAESMMIESVGDVILYVMAEQQTAEAIRDAFLALQ